MPDVLYPKISVVTCSYNQGKFLADAIESVIQQNYPNLEYIVIDGGSRDASVEIIRRYQKDIDYWVSEPDRGQSDALCKGFERATGDILCWLCSDDMLEPGALLEVGRIFAENPAIEALYGDTIFIDAENNVTRRYRTIPFSRWLMLNTANYIPQPSAFWRRSLYERVGGLDRSMDVNMDPDLWLRFSEVAQLHHTPRYWSRMRFYPEIKSIARSQEHKDVHKQFEIRYLGNRTKPVRLVSRALAKVFRIASRAWHGCYWP